MMEVTKTNEQYRVQDTYTYNGTEYPLQGSANKSNNSVSVWVQVEGIGSVSYSSPNGSTSLNVEFQNNSIEVPFKEFMSDMYDKIWKIITRINQ